MASTTNASSTTTAARAPVQLASLLVGATFLLVGILGFVPGITQGEIAFAGVDSDAMLLGIFAVSVLHNLVHLLFGVVGLTAARTAQASKGFLVGAGVVYLVLFAYGMVVDKASDANFVPLNAADDWLHLALGALMVVLGLALTGERAAGTTRRVAG